MDATSSCPHALCLLILIGAEDEPRDIPEEYDCDNLGSFPDEDTFRMIVLPKNDPFGISQAVCGVNSAQAMAEVYASHPFAYGEKSDDPKGALRAKSDDKLVEFVSDLFGALSVAPKETP